MTTTLFDIAIVVGAMLAVVIPLYLLFFRPVFRRLAVRQATRRPRETALIVLGAMLGTALITGSLILGDGLSASIRHSAYTQLGPIDEIVKSPNVANSSDLLAHAKQIPQSSNIDGMLAGASGSGSVRLTKNIGAFAPSVQLLEFDSRKRADLETTHLLRVLVV